MWAAALLDVPNQCQRLVLSGLQNRSDSCGSVQPGVPGLPVVQGKANTRFRALGDSDGQGVTKEWAS